MIARGVLKLLVFSKRIELVCREIDNARAGERRIDSYDVDGLEPERSHPITVDATRGDGNLILIQFNQLVSYADLVCQIENRLCLQKANADKAVKKQYDR